MKTKTSSLHAAVIYAIFGLLACLIVGYLFSEKWVFVPTNPSYAFFVYGVTGAVLFSILKFSTMRNFLYGAALLLALYVIWARIHYPGVILVRLLQFAGIAAAIYLYHHFYEARLQELRFGKFLVLGGAIAVVNLLLTVLVAPFANVEDLRLVIEHQTFYGFFIGCGLGIGFEIAEFLLTKSLQVKTV